MSLFLNDIFSFNGERLRLLSWDAAKNIYWCISVDNSQAWPCSYPSSALRSLVSEPTAEGEYRNYSAASQRVCDRAWKRLEQLRDEYKDDLFAVETRNKCILEFAKIQNCSPVTLRKDLRKYWQGGQSQCALMPGYARCGRACRRGANNDYSITAGRGRKAKGRSTYQIKFDDCKQMAQMLEKWYLKDERATVMDAYVELVRKHYQQVDGNLKPQNNWPGDLPSLRQFRYFLLKNYDIEQRKRQRVGDSDYEREHRKVLGTVLDDCLGVGHQYEIDATIADVYLVSSTDRNKIVGKPTLYFVVDRKSRLVTGFYFGLENPSWNAALQAIYSISEDKRALCERYGVEYCETDWPAHQVFPQEFLADRGEMISGPSANISAELQITVANLPAKRPDWKPLVENQFCLTHNTLRSSTPAYDPPSNATRRRGKHYEKDACLTVMEFGHLIFNAIIHNNRREILNYELTPAELLDGVRPSPLELWSHGIVSRSGSLTRFHEKKVRFSLLRKEAATVTQHGIEFRGCAYICSQAIAGKWLESARQKRFKVTVSFDPRLVDQIYVHSRNGKEEPYLATLTERSKSYRGLSFEELKYLQSLRAQMRLESETSRLQNTVDYRNAVEPVVRNAKKSLKAAGARKSRTARRADIKETRFEERAKERAVAARLDSDSQPQEARVIPVAMDAIRVNALSTGLNAMVLERMKIGNAKPEEQS